MAKRREDIVMLAHKLKRASDLDPEQWLMSEKLDGMRGVWTGSELLTRRGLPITGAPAWWLEGLPPGTPLDGELWLGRGTRDEGNGICRRHDWGGDARRVAFVVFDIFEGKGAFEGRLRRLRGVVERQRVPWLIAHAHRPMGSPSQLQAELRRVESVGGEGLVLRRRGSPYVVARSHDCLKVKSFHDDEAVVTDHYRGPKGKPGVFADWAGTKIKIANGFRLDGSNRPPVGSRITFGYFEKTKAGQPYHGFFIGIA